MTWAWGLSRGNVACHVAMGFVTWAWACHVGASRAAVDREAWGKRISGPIFHEEKEISRLSRFQPQHQLSSA